MNTRLHGLVAATHTPFHPDGSLAPEVVPVQAAYLADRGVGIVFITGSTGESHSLTRDERLSIFGAWASAGPACGLRVVAHVGGNCLEDARYFAAAADDCGFEAIAALSPSYFKPARIEVLVDVCARIASAAPALPFYFYDIPSMTQVRFDMKDFLSLAGERIPNLAGIKFTNDDLGAFATCLKHEGGRYDIPWGIDEKLVNALEAGALGAVGSSYNFAAPLYQALIAAFRAGEIDRARDLQRESVELIETLYSVGYFGGAKALMGWLGVPVGPARSPLDNPTPAQLDAVRAKLDGFRWFGDSRRQRAGAATACTP